MDIFNKKFFFKLSLLVVAFLLLNGLNNTTLVSAARKSKVKVKAPIVNMKKAKKADSKSAKKPAPKTGPLVVQKKQALLAPTVLEGIWKTQESLYDFDETSRQYRQTASEKGFIEFKGNRYCPLSQFDDNGLFTCAQYHFFTLSDGDIKITYEDAPNIKTDGTWQISGDKLELVLITKIGSDSSRSKKILTQPQLASKDKLKTLNGVWKATKAFTLNSATEQYIEDSSESLDIYFSFLGYRFCDAYLEDGRLRCGSGYGTWTLVGDSINSVAAGQDIGLKIKGNELEYFGGGKGVVKYILQKTNFTPVPLASSSVVQE